MINLTPEEVRALAAEYRAGLSDEQRAQEDAESEQQHAAEIDLLRGQLGDALAQVQRSLAEAASANDALRGDRIFDWEFAEGVGTDVAAFLADAARMTRAVVALFELATR